MIGEFKESAKALSGFSGSQFHINNFAKCSDMIQCQPQERQAEVQLGITDWLAFQQAENRTDPLIVNIQVEGQVVLL